MMLVKSPWWSNSSRVMVRSVAGVAAAKPRAVFHGLEDLFVGPGFGDKVRSTGLDALHG